jgi:dehydrogluconokinase
MEGLPTRLEMSVEFEAVIASRLAPTKPVQASLLAMRPAQSLKI